MGFSVARVIVLSDHGVSVMVKGCTSPRARTDVDR